MAQTESMAATLEHRKETYSNSYSNNTSNNYSNSNCNSTNDVSISAVFASLADVIPDDDYKPFYIKKFRELGARRFVVLANKARSAEERRQGGDRKRLFVWMLKNPSLVV